MNESKHRMHSLAKEFVRSRLNTSVWARYVWLLGQYRYMNDLGYFRSAYSRMPVDAQDRPIPWFTYSAISFLGDRLTKELTLFEYGSGSSTLFFASRVLSVDSVEHSVDWYEKMRPKLPANVNYAFCALDHDGRYCRSALASGRSFDVMVIDGRDRVNCVLNSTEALRSSGVFIWDNSERRHYTSGQEYLLRLGFKRLDFWGPAPCSGTGYCTSVFYRTENCLNI